MVVRRPTGMPIRNSDGTALAGAVQALRCCGRVLGSGRDVEGFTILMNDSEAIASFE